MDKLCGFVPKTSVETALGRSDFTVSGDVTAARTKNADGTALAAASCSVSVPKGGQTPAFSIKVVPFSEAAGAGILRTAKLPNDFVYPQAIGVGFASRDTYRDAAGKSHQSCESGLVRGDWVITLGIEIPGEGRNVLDDTVALAQEVVDELDLPLKPTTPYPSVS